MKCPNCGKEAIFVNGKYVCLDCGIEITPEQQAAQNLASEQIQEVRTLEDPVSPSSQPISEDIAPATQVEPFVPNLETEDQASLAAPVETLTAAAKPVQQYYENALAENENQSSTEAHSGVYDFSENQGTPKAVEEPVADLENSVEPTLSEMATDPVPATEPEASLEPEPAITNISPSEPTLTITNEPDSSPAATSVEPETYFSPNTFDIQEGQKVAPGAMPAVASDVEPIGAPAELSPVSLETPVESQQQEVTELVENTVPEQAVQNNSIPIEPEAKTLDDMLGDESSGEAEVPETVSPISAFGPTPIVGEPNLTNVTAENPMPSVESVFGTSSQEPAPESHDSKMPTAQDFGVAPKPEPKKKNKLVPIIIAAVAGLLLLGGGAFAIIALTGEKEVTYPVVLSETEITNLSSAVSTAIQQPQGIATDYNFEANLSKLTVKDDMVDKAAAEKQVGSNYELSGSWYTDPDEDIMVDFDLANLNDKRTYISQEEKTYIYNSETQKYDAQNGLLVAGVPAFADVEEKTALLYATNIKGMSLLGKEQIGGSEYSKYQITPDSEIIKETLAVMGGIFEDADYTNMNTDALNLYVWVSSDNKIQKTSLSGEIEIDTASVSGTININGEATYQYLEVSIENPETVTEAKKNTETSVSEVVTENEEEVETSSIDNGAKDSSIVEAKG